MKRQNRPRGRGLKAIGSASIVLGRGLPTLAYGYIGYDLYRRRAGPKEINDTIYRTTFGHSFDEQVEVAHDFHTGITTVANLALHSPLRNLLPFA